MKKSVIKFFIVFLSLFVAAGCATRNEVASGPVAAQLQAVPGMEKMNVAVILDDQRPQAKQIRYRSGNIERPEHYFNKTINLTGFTVDYLNREKLFNSVSTIKAEGCYTLKLIWKSSHLNLNTWIPYVIRFQNHMTIDMVLTAPDGKVLWRYLLDGRVVNTPSGFRSFSSHRCDLFQERVLENQYPVAFHDMCLKLAAQLKK